MADLHTDVSVAELNADVNGDEIRIKAGSRKSMLVRLALELWRRDRFDLRELIETRGKRIRAERQAFYYLARSPTADLEPLVAGALNGDHVIIEGCVTGAPERKLLERLGVELPNDNTKSEEKLEPIRFIDMTPALLGFAAVIMALRYLALGLSDRELYVMAGIGYAAFILIRTFSYKLKRPKNAPTPKAFRDDNDVKNERCHEKL